jgi:hypothetical protein
LIPRIFFISMCEILIGRAFDWLGVYSVGASQQRESMIPSGGW